MNQYKPITSITRCKKDWTCNYCNLPIYHSELSFKRKKLIKFFRISKKGILYQPIIELRYHLSCAKKYLTLTYFEQDLFIKNKDIINPNERKLQHQITSYLNHAERTNKLIFIRNFTGLMQDINAKKRYPLGKRGFPDFTIFLQNNRILFIELKAKYKKLNNYQEIFKTKIENLNYDYKIISSILELRQLLDNYIN